MFARKNKKKYIYNILIVVALILYEYAVKSVRPQLTRYPGAKIQINHPPSQKKKKKSGPMNKLNYRFL